MPIQDKSSVPQNNHRHAVEVTPMRDQFLFDVAPRLAVLSAVLALIVQCTRILGRRAVGRVRDGAENPADGLTACWRVSMAVILLGHVVAFAIPGEVLVWDRQPLRLLVLESAGWLAGGLALGCFIGMAIRRRSFMASRDPASPLEAIASTLVLLEVVSGLAIATEYRWASSWSAVTLVPYVYSLTGARPSLLLVTSMPFLVKLHVFAAFAVVGVLPWTGLGREAVLAAWGLRRVDVRSLPLAWRLAGLVISGSPERTVPVRDAEPVTHPRRS
jgi:nitrate reductase gamma subunit